jgi:hypothetical protein
LVICQKDGQIQVQRDKELVEKEKMVLPEVCKRFVVKNKTLPDNELEKYQSYLNAWGFSNDY